MAHALCNIHDRSVIVADIACRNLLLDSTLAIKFCDFTESTIMPQDTDMEFADDNGYSIQTVIGQLGKVIYEVVSGGTANSSFTRTTFLERRGRAERLSQVQRRSGLGQSLRNAGPGMALRMPLTMLKRWTPCLKIRGLPQRHLSWNARALVLLLL
jgi:hypothetical protein